MMTLAQKAETLEEAVKRSMSKGFSVFGLANNPKFLWRVTVSSDKIILDYKLKDSDDIWQYGKFTDAEIFFDHELSFFKWLIGDEKEAIDFVKNKFLENKGRYDALKGILTRQDKSEE